MGDRELKRYPGLGGSDNEEETLIVFETSDSVSHTLTLKQLDGTLHLFRTVQLLHAELTPSRDNLTLLFPTHTVAITGFALQPIFDALAQDRLALVRAFDKRYASQVLESDPFVKEIEVEGRGD
ncbi:MAG TPA: hypothetical protein DCE41_15835 [Cytophagales bacterium]|nr:hypothetical protein [Cytophagales bacterium]HAA23369.1 hypothetical protein [Cytophagales bacterium]HAP63681.1 hypothetical protein [Cytophagales bacterium]